MNPHHSDDEKLMNDALKALENFARFQRMMMDGPDVSDKLLAEDYAEAGFLQGAKTITALRERLAQPEQESVAHCEAGPEHCPVCHEESSPAQQPVQKPEPPPWWPAVENILSEYGLQAIDFVADFKEAMKQAEQDPMAKVELMTTGGNAGLATRIVEIEDHLRERLRPGQLLYTAPQRREWVGLTDDEVDEWTPEIHSVIRSIEAKLKEKNT